MKYDALKEKIIEKIKEIYDPEIPVNLYDLGLIYSIDCIEKEDYTRCTVTMTLTSASCPVSENLYDQIEDIAYVVEGEGNLEVVPNLVFDPPWSKDMMSDEAKLSLGML